MRKPKTRVIAAAALCILAAPRVNRDARTAEAVLGKSPDLKQVTLRIEKSKFRLTVLYRGKVAKTYAVVFGGNPVDDKLREGDGCTPEGTFHLVRLYPRKPWRRFMLLDYPTADSWRKHDAAKKAGTIPRNARIGGEIGIHGVPDGADHAIAERQNWTLGCVSLRNADIEELYALCRRGTEVKDQPGAHGHAQDKADRRGDMPSRRSSHLSSPPLRRETGCPSRQERGRRSAWKRLCFRIVHVGERICISKSRPRFQSAPRTTGLRKPAQGRHLSQENAILSVPGDPRPDICPAAVALRTRRGCGYEGGPGAAGAPEKGVSPIIRRRKRNTR